MIELAEVVRQLRSELNLARAASDDEELRFLLGPIELEVTVALEREGGLGGKVRFWVVELGADAKATATSTQRIKLTLTPQLLESAHPASAGSPSPVSVYISSQENAGER